MTGKILRVPNGNGHLKLVKIKLHFSGKYGLLDSTNGISFENKISLDFTRHCKQINLVGTILQRIEPLPH